MKKKKSYKYTGPGSGVMAQIGNADGIKYSDFSLKDMEDLIDTLMADMPEDAMAGILEIKPNTLNLKVEDQIKEGYLYQMGGGKFTAVTGYKGILQYVDSLREKGMGDTIILNEIKVLDTEGIMTNTKYIPLIDVVWKEIGT